MPAKRKALLGIRSADGRHSGIFQFFTRRDQIYVTGRGFGGLEKISFHTPTYCQHAYDPLIELPPEIERRQTVIWQRQRTLPRGMGEAVVALEINVPTDSLTRSEENVPGVIWIKSAPPRRFTSLRCCFTEESYDTVCIDFSEDRVPLFWNLGTGENFLVLVTHGQLPVLPTAKIPPSLHERRYMIIGGDDPDDTGFPIRFSTFSRPSDGEQLAWWQHGSYWSETDKPEITEVFQRNIVVARSRTS